MQSDATTQPNNTSGSAGLPCAPVDNCSNTSENCTADPQRATVAVAVLVGSGIGIISVTALVFIPIAVVAGVLKQRRRSLKQGRKKGEIYT